MADCTAANALLEQMPATAILHGEKGCDSDIGKVPNVARWLEAIKERPAVQRAVQVLVDRRKDITKDPRAKEMLFGATQYAQR